MAQLVYRWMQALLHRHFLSVYAQQHYSHPSNLYANCWFNIRLSWLAANSPSYILPIQKAILHKDGLFIVA